MGFSDFINSIESFNACIEMSQHTGAHFLTLRAAANACLSYSCLGKEAEARKYLDLAQQKRSYISNPYAGFVINMSKAFVERYFGSEEKALSLLKQNLSMARSGRVHPDKAVNVLSEITELYEKRGQQDSLRRYLDMYYTESVRQHQNNLIVDCMRLYMNYHIQHNNLDSAIIYQKRYFALKDSIQDIRNFMATTGMHTQILKKKDKTTILKQSSLISRQWTFPFGNAAFFVNLY